MRFFVGGIATESNGFVSYPTPRRDFHVYRTPGPGAANEKVLSAGVTWWPLIAQRGHELVPGLNAWAMPSGPVTRSAYESMRDELLDDLRRGLPLDGVLLDLHGAMVADGYPDPEGDLIEKCRSVVGAAVPIGVFLDLHCHLTRRMADFATVIIAEKEWPHVDVPERATEIFELVLAAAQGRCRPVMALFDCRMIGAYPTRVEPMASFVNRLRAAEREPGVLSVSLAHGYPWADVPDVGTKTLVVTDGDPALAAARARDLGREFFALRDRVTERADFRIDEALDYAMAATDHPVVLCEQGDNHLGGTAGDGTAVLARVVERKVPNVAFGPIWDPMAVDICTATGEGERLQLRIGGKAGPESGSPVDLFVTVRHVIKNLIQPPLGDIQAMPFGDAVRVSAAHDLDLIIHAKRAGTLRPEVLTDFGIDLAKKQIVVCKMWRHGQVGFAGVARDFKFLLTPGAQTLDFAAIPFRRFDKPYWPRVSDPFAP